MKPPHAYASSSVCRENARAAKAEAGVLALGTISNSKRAGFDFFAVGEGVETLPLRNGAERVFGRGQAAIVRKSETRTNCWHNLARNAENLARNSAGAGGNPPVGGLGEGTCAAVCVPTASFAFDSRVSADELRSGVLRACRNQNAECYEGTLPAVGSVGNSVGFPTTGGWTGPSVYSEDDWKTIRLSWEGLVARPAFADGDRFTLTLERPGGETKLLDWTIGQFDTRVICAGWCLQASVDLRGAASLDNSVGSAGAGGAPSP